jgi:hypothetical protein
MNFFNDNNDLLSSFIREENFFLDPFPHIIIENCLPEKIYNQIEANYPDLNTLDYLVKKTGKLSSLKFIDIMNKKNLKIDSIFYDFFNYHSSHKFLFKLIKIFNSEINSKNVTNKLIHYLSQFKSPEDLIKSNIIDVITTKTPSININYSPLKSNAIRSVHLDRSQNIIGCLFYFKDEKDIDNGGDLELYSWKYVSDFYKKLYFTDPLDFKHVSFNKTIKYDRNKIVIFVNSMDSLHLAATRKENSPIRRHLYLSADLKNKDVFKKENIFTKIINKSLSFVK